MLGMIIIRAVAVAFTLVCNVAYAFLFDSTDYSPVEKAFNTSDHIHLFSFIPNELCKGRIETYKYSVDNQGSPHGRMRPYERFTKAMGRAIAYDMQGRYQKSDAHRADFKTYVEYLVQASREQYFTKNKWVKNGSSPAYAQTVLLINLSVFMNYMDVHDLWRNDEREVVRDWGNEIYKRSHYDHYSNGKRQSDRWPDTVSKAAAAYMLWGVVNKDLKIFKDGYRDFLALQKKIKPDGSFKQHILGPFAGDLEDDQDLYLESKTIGDLVIAAYAGELVGMSSFTMKNTAGGNVEKLVTWLDEISFGEENLTLHKGFQDIRHLSNARADSLSWVTFYRQLDSKDDLELVKAHLKYSDPPGSGAAYNNSLILTSSRCLANELLK